MSAIDVANFTAVPTDDQVRCLRDSGVTRAIVGASYGYVARGQWQAFAGGGLELEGYAWLTSQAWYDTTVGSALRQLAGLPVQRWWLDCEEDMGVLIVEAVRERIRHALSMFAATSPAARRGIYTTASWWQEQTNGWDIVAEFPDVDLFEAHYVHADGDPCAGVDAERAQIPAFVPFGGWTSRAMVQWHPSTRVCPADDTGLNVDLDEIEEDPLSGPTKEEFGALFELTVHTRDAVVAIGGAVVDLAKHVYGQDEPRLVDLGRQLDELKAKEGTPAS
jgi:hypothetical protein